MKFRMWFKYGLKAQKLLAQGIALGMMAISKAPCNYPGRCPGLGAFALSGRFNRTVQKVFSKKSAQRFGSFKRLHYLCIIEKRMTSIDR